LSLQKLTTNRPKLPIIEPLTKIKLFSKIKSYRWARFRNQKILLPERKKKDKNETRRLKT